MRWVILAGCVAMLAAVRPAAAQEWGVTHRIYTFLGTDLTIDVITQAPGTLELMHGQGGQLEVTGRALHGMAASALGENQGFTLRLSGMGADQVQYMVVVPENTYVRVNLPDGKVAETFSTTTGSASYTWKATQSDDDTADAGAGSGSAGASTPTGSPEPSSPSDESLFTTYADVSAPAVVTFPSAAVFRSLTVRLEGNQFRVAASRPMTLKRGDPKSIAIRPEGPPMDVVLVVPAMTKNFVVDVGGQPAMAIVRGQPMSMCTPVVEQLLDGGRLWFTFTPVDGALRCSSDKLRAARKGA